MILVLLSGGLDSTTCLALACEKAGNKNVVALCSEYGQKHDKELICAERVADYYGVRLLKVNLESILSYSDCSLLKHSDRRIKKGDYADQTKEAGGNPVETYVPFRNGLFLSVAASVAISLGYSEVWYGAHKDDAAGSAYPDCSVAFVEKMNEAVVEGGAGKVRLYAPFINSNKAGIVKEGLRLGVPYELTWSCYEGGERPCGECGTCRDRRRAFEANGAIDPLEE